jgi:hypothetical protein
MKFVAATTLSLSIAAAGLVATGHAQQKPADANDPRIGLKAGLHDAGEAARNMKRVASLPKPQGFFDPAKPGGDVIPPERDPNAPPPPPPDPNAPPSPQANMLGFANSDLAFAGNHVFMGSFHGFTTYDVERPTKPKFGPSVVCPGGQGDISVHGNLLFMSVEQTRGRLDCGAQGIQTAVSNERFRGVRIFDITDLNKPRQVAAVQTCRGSHTHTIVPDPNDKGTLYVYGSGTSGVRPGEELAGCSKEDADKDPNTSLYSIDVIRVPLAHPEQAAVVNRPRIFADMKTGAVNGLNKGGDSGPGTQKMSVTNQCHDITVYPEVGLAAGACSGNGLLLDIRDPKNPVRLDYASDKNFAYWHSATFNNDGTKVIFTDEWGGGARPRCRATDLMNWGADAIFDIVDKKLVFEGYYKMPAPQTEQENCVAHNGSLIPVPGRDIMVQAWYQGGVSVFDFTDSKTPVEIAFFDRGPIDAKSLVLGGFWSAYWYNGNIYGSEISRGIDIFTLTPSEYLSQNELDAALMVHLDEVNTQEQGKFVFPAASPVAKAYLDQLNRTHGIQAPRASAIRTALDKADEIKSSKDKNAATVSGQLDELAKQVDADASSATGRDAMRLKALAETLRGRSAKLKA